MYNPSLTVFLPEKEKANGVGIVIAPGGGLRKLGIRGGGEEPARFLAEHGFTSFVLKYRLSRQPGQPYKFEEHVLADGQRAIRLVRYRAQEFNLDPKKIGMLGFSAGGEVVSITCYKPGEGNPDAADPIDREFAKPNFQMLVYPGPVGIPSKLPNDTPPAFMVIAADDAHTSILLNMCITFVNSTSTTKHISSPVEDMALAWENGQKERVFNIGQTACSIGSTTKSSTHYLNNFYQLTGLSSPFKTSIKVP